MDWSHRKTIKFLKVFPSKYDFLIEHFTTNTVINYQFICIVTLLELLCSNISVVQLTVSPYHRECISAVLLFSLTSTVNDFKIVHTVYLTECNYFQIIDT